MGRPRKPLAVLEISGADRKNPQRYRGRKAAAKLVAAGLGDPPTEWTEGADHNGRLKALVETWNQIVAQDVLHVLNVSHRLLVENTCYLMYKIRRASAGFGKAPSGDYAQVKANLAVMGMTPIDSSKVAEAVRVPERGSGSSGGRGAGGGWGELVG
jgi:hypothetical protein